MNIDVTALRGLVREKDVSFDTVVEAIESALLAAYQRTEGAAEQARVELDRKSGEVRVWAQEVDEDGDLQREWDDTPGDFGRVAAMTAKQVIMSRLRDAQQETTYGEWAGKEGDLVSGVIQAPAGMRPSSSTSVTSRRCSPRPSRCRGRTTSTASGCAAMCCRCTKGYAARR